MKKFSQNEILINTLKTYPKIKIFVNNGNIYYNNNLKSGPELNDFLLGLDQEISAIPAGAIFTEASEPLLTEDGDYIIIE